MSHPHFTHRAPRARQDPVRCADDALAIVELARSWPPRDEIIAFLLDDAQRGLGTIVDLTDVRAPADVLLVAELMGGAASTHIAAGHVTSASLVVASVRVTETSVLDDVDLWEQLDEVADEHGAALREWFVIGPTGVMCPREVLGAPSRWG